MRSAFVLFSALVGLTSAAAQTVVPIPFACTETDIDHFGLTCSAEHPCKVFADLSFIDAAGAKVFIAGNLHTEATTLYSLLFSSEDSGGTWTEAYQRIRSGSFDQIQFLDFQHGWISGGLILALPRDPFFLVTRDGGKTWQDRPVFDEGGIGAITEFWFVDRLNGQVVIDHTRKPENGNRYELHETMTGGETWIPKQLSPKALKVSRSHSAGDRGWRLEPDAKSKTTRVEVERDGKWSTVAIFPIEVNSCRPPEPKEIPAPR